MYYVIDFYARHHVVHVVRSCVTPCCPIKTMQARITTFSPLAGTKTLFYVFVMLFRVRYY